MKGWVYVISNPAMPGLVKVGYSTKDPDLRAAELNHTGAPHAYVVEYEILIDEPRVVEQMTHSVLSMKHEAKEWFRCPPEEAVLAIRQVANNRGLLESFRRLDRQRAEEAQLRRNEARDRERERHAALSVYWDEIRLHKLKVTPEPIREQFSRFVGPNIDEEEISRCELAIQSILNGRVDSVEARKIIVGIRLKMAVGAPRDNIVSTVLTSYSHIIPTSLVSKIVEVISEEAGYDQ